MYMYTVYITYYHVCTYKHNICTVILIYIYISWSFGRLSLFSNLFEGCCDVGHGFVLILLMVNGFVLFSAWTKAQNFLTPNRISSCLLLKCEQTIAIHRLYTALLAASLDILYAICHMQIHKYDVLNWQYLSWLVYIHSSGAMSSFFVASRQLLGNPQHRTLSLCMNWSCSLLLPVAIVYISPSIIFDISVAFRVISTQLFMMTNRFSCCVHWNLRPFRRQGTDCKYLEHLGGAVGSQFLDSTALVCSEKLLQPGKFAEKEDSPLI